MKKILVCLLVMVISFISGFTVGMVAEDYGIITEKSEVTYLAVDGEVLVDHENGIY